MATAKAAAKSSQWWFHIYNSLQQFREGEAENETTGTSFFLLNSHFTPIRAKVSISQKSMAQKLVFEWLHPYSKRTAVKQGVPQKIQLKDFAF